MYPRVQVRLFAIYPVILRRDCFRVEKQDTKLSKFWAKVPVHGGSIWVPIQLPNNQEDLLNCNIRETKLVKSRKGWFLHITVQKEVQLAMPRRWVSEQPIPSSSLN